MNLISRLVTGIVTIKISLIVFVAGFFTEFLLWIYAVPLFVIGVFILFNRSEDKIEPRKDSLKLKGGNKI